MLADKKTNEKIKNKINENKEKINEINQEIHLNIFENFQVKQIIIILKVK